MSATIDQRVVEMRFDNKQFESNVSTTMSTLGKLKQSLNLTGAAKGLESVGNAAKDIQLGGLGSAVETVTAKFSALQVMGITALTRITNAAITAGNNIVKSLTIDPIRTGFQEYETKMAEIEAKLMNPGPEDDVMDLTRAYLENKRELDYKMEEWEQLNEQLES